MYTANIINKVAQPDGTIKIEVQFTNGTITTPSEFVTPSDKNGLDYYIKGRLDALNFVAPDVGPYVPPAPVVPPALTQAEIDLNNFSKWMQLTIALNAAKQMGWITGDEPMVVNVKNKVLALAAVNLPKMFL